MREILFRGKAANRENGRFYRTSYKNGDWVYGLLTDTGNYAGFAEMTNTDGVQGIEVDKGTVGQFTGVTDKNGKKIFEGDIIRSNNGKQSCVSVVKFGEYFPQMFYKMLDMYIPGKRKLQANGFFAVSVDKKEEMILFQSPCVTVIGNIFDNPELWR